MSEWRYIAEQEEDTARLGAMLAEVMPADTVVALVGTLGAGKTRLVQGVVESLGVSPGIATSPTFVLINEYLDGSLPVYHFDAYRLAGEEEFLQLGPEEYFAGGGITFVEWADRVAGCLPADFLTIRIEVFGESERVFIVSAQGDNSDSIVRKLSAVNPV